ncbi:hypothetical protein L7F22_028349 [Adiantum nelumboides]|nr:hypothetical protein [Adiantum nelumboides]
MASGEGQSNPSTSGDAGRDHHEDFGNEYGPPLPAQEELREMEHRRLVGEATNLMLNFAKDPKLAKYMSKTAFQDVQAQLRATTTSPPKPESKKQYSEKELEEEIDARLARILGAQKQGRKHGRKRKKSTNFNGYLGSQSTFDKAKKHKKYATVPSSSSSSESSSESSEEERSKKRSTRHRHGKGKRKSRSRRADDSSTADSSTDSSESEDGHFYANKKNFYKANQYDFLEDKSKKVREFKEGGQSIKFETFSGYKDASKALSFIQQFDIAFAGGRYSEHSKIRRAVSYLKGNARIWWSTLLLNRTAPVAAKGVEKPSDWPYAIHLLGHIVISDLNGARFLWKRIPADAKQTQPELTAAWKIGQCLWTHDYAGVHDALQCYPWSPAVQQIVNVIKDDYSRKNFKLLSTAYSTISVADAAKFLGLTESETVKSTTQNGWTLDPASNMLTVVPAVNLAAQKLDASKLQDLTEYVFHLEH